MLSALYAFDSFKLSDFFKHYIQTLPDMDKFKSPVVEAILETSLKYLFKYEKEDSIDIRSDYMHLIISNLVTSFKLLVKIKKNMFNKQNLHLNKG